MLDWMDTWTYVSTVKDNYHASIIKKPPKYLIKDILMEREYDPASLWSKQSGNKKLITYSINSQILEDTQAGIRFGLKKFGLTKG